MAITKISAAMTDLDGAVTINESSADVDFRVESNGDANMLFVDGGNNRVLIGTAASRAMSGVTPNLFIEGNSGYNDSSLGLVVNSNSTGEIPTLLFGRSRGTSDGAVTILQSGDRIASIRAHGADGTDFEQSAAIEFYVDATPGANEVPGRIGFYTTPDGSQYLTEKMRIDNAGHVTKPLQSAFLANAATMSNIAVDGARTVTFSSEVFDQNADFNTSTYTFTAPVTGKYHLTANIRVDSVPTDATYFRVYIITSNRNIMGRIFDPDGYDSTPAYDYYTANSIVDMDASDTAYVVVYQYEGTAQADIQADSIFSGYLVA